MALTAIIALAALSGLVSCSSADRRCNDLAVLAADPAVQAALVDWVESRRADLQTAIRACDAGQLRYPGDCAVRLPEAEFLGIFSRTREARLLIAPEERVEAVFFGDTPGQGIVVGATEADGFVMVGSSITAVTDRIAVVCMERD